MGLHCWQLLQQEHCSAPETHWLRRLEQHSSPYLVRQQLSAMGLRSLAQQRLWSELQQLSCLAQPQHYLQLVLRC